MDLSRHIAQKFSELSSPLSDAALDKIASILVRTEVKKNTLYLKEGEVSKYIGYVYKGMLRLFYYKNKKDLTEHFACEGTNFFSIESFFRQQPTHLMIEALENSVVYGLPHDELLELAAEHYEIEVMYRTLIENSLILSQQKADTLRVGQRAVSPPAPRASGDYPARAVVAHRVVSADDAGDTEPGTCEPGIVDISQ